MNSTDTQEYINELVNYQIENIGFRELCVAIICHEDASDKDQEQAQESFYNNEHDIDDINAKLSELCGV